MNIYTDALKYEHKFNQPIILDIGANIGIEGEKIFNLHQDATLIMVEPLFSNVMEIYKKIQSKNMIGRWFVENCAIDNSCNFHNIMFHLSDAMAGRGNSSLDSFNWKNWNYTHHERVRTKTIEQICPNPDIVKIDIERHEYNVLPSIAKMQSIKAIFLEAHGPCFQLNIIDFINKSLNETGLVASGWWTQYQSQTEGVIDNFSPVEPQETINCGDYRYIVLEREE